MTPVRIPLRVISELIACGMVIMFLIVLASLAQQTTSASDVGERLARIETQVESSRQGGSDERVRLERIERQIDTLASTVAQTSAQVTLMIQIGGIVATVLLANALIPLAIRALRKP